MVPTNYSIETLGIDSKHFFILKKFDPDDHSDAVWFPLTVPPTSMTVCKTTDATHFSLGSLSMLL